VNFRCAAINGDNLHIATATNAAAGEIGLLASIASGRKNTLKWGHLFQTVFLRCK
jgi:hypothetical protein